MSEDTYKELQDQLIYELGSYGIDCEENQAELLIKHLLLVIEKNKVMNLTRIVDIHEALSLHVVDSLLPLACLDVRMSLSNSFVDIGTGAGFPGIPLGIITGASGLLVDSVGKKVKAVNEFIYELELPRLTALHSRIEDLDSSLLRRQDYVFARAVAQANVLIEYSAPLLSLGGVLVLEKGNPKPEEIEHASRAAQICGLEFISRETFELPHNLGHREILLYQKVGEPSIKLPRQAGTAKRNPLG